MLDETCHVDVLYQAIVTHRFHQRLLPIISVGHRGSVGGPLGDGVGGQPGVTLTKTCEPLGAVPPKRSYEDM